MSVKDYLDKMKNVSGQGPQRPGFDKKDSETVKVDDFVKELAGIKPTKPGLDESLLEEGLPKGKKGEWNLHLMKSGSKVKITVVNPQGGSESGYDSKSFKSALALMVYKAAQGHKINEADSVWVIESVWDRAKGDWKVKKSYWHRLVKEEARNRTIDLGNNEKKSKGVYDNEDGSFTAMTFSKSKTFKSKKAAEKWFKRMTEDLEEAKIMPGSPQALKPWRDPLKWMVAVHMHGDIKMGKNYLPVKQVMGNREKSRQYDSFQPIGERTVGKANQYYQERWGDQGAYVGYRDNRDKTKHRDMMLKLEKAFRKAGYKTRKRVAMKGDPLESITLKVLFDQKRVAQMEGILSQYLPMLQKAHGMSDQEVRKVKDWFGMKESSVRGRMEDLLEAAPSSELLQEIAKVMQEKHSSLFKVKTSATRVTLEVIPDRQLQKVFVSHQSSGKVGLLWHYPNRTRTKSNVKGDLDKVVSRILQEARIPYRG